MTPRFSAIVPTYNRADLLPATLDAILDQDQPVAELIVVVDGATDDTLSVLAGYGDRLAVCQQPNAGPQAARNTGIAAATGDWLLFCDDDDLWQPDHTAALAAVVAERPDLRLVFTDFRHLTDGVVAPTSKFDSAPPGFWEPLTVGAAGPARLLDGRMAVASLRFQPIFPSCIAIRRAIAQQVGGFDCRMRGVKGEDWEFFLRVLSEGGSAALGHPTVLIRKHAGNDSADRTALRLGEVQILEHALAHHAWAAEHASAIRAEIVARRAQAFDLAFAAGDHEQVRRLWPLLPPAARDGRRRIKAAVAALPAMVARPLNRLAQRLAGG